MDERSDKLKKVNEIVCDILDNPQIHIDEQTIASDVPGWDSLAYISILTAIESQFNFRFTMNQIISMKDIGEMLDILPSIPR